MMNILYDNIMLYQQIIVDINPIIVFVIDNP